MGDLLGQWEVGLIGGQTNATLGPVHSIQLIVRRAKKQISTNTVCIAHRGNAVAIPCYPHCKWLNVKCCIGGCG